MEERRRVDPPLSERWQHAERRQAEACPDFFWRLDAAVDVFEEEGEANPEDQPSEGAEHRVLPALRRRGRTRPLGFVDDANVARLERARDTRLLRALQEAVVDLLAALDVAREHAVFDGPAVHRERFVLLLLQRPDEAL